MTDVGPPDCATKRFPTSSSILFLLLTLRAEAYQRSMFGSPSKTERNHASETSPCQRGNDTKFTPSARRGLRPGIVPTGNPSNPGRLGSAPAGRAHQVRSEIRVRPLAQARCRRVAPLLRWYCERIGPLCIPWVSLGYPLGIRWVY